METYPEQFPDESQPDPSRRAEDRVFDARHSRRWLPGATKKLSRLKGRTQETSRTTICGAAVILEFDPPKAKGRKRRKWKAIFRSLPMPRELPGDG